MSLGNAPSSGLIIASFGDGSNPNPLGLLVYDLSQKQPPYYGEFFFGGTAFFGIAIDPITPGYIYAISNEPSVQVGNFRLCLISINMSEKLGLTLTKVWDYPLPNADAGSFPLTVFGKYAYVGAEYRGEAWPRRLYLPDPTDAATLPTYDQAFANNAQTGFIEYQDELCLGQDGLLYYSTMSYATGAEWGYPVYRFDPITGSRIDVVYPWQTTDPGAADYLNGQIDAKGPAATHKGIILYPGSQSGLSLYDTWSIEIINRFEPDAKIDNFGGTFTSVAITDDDWVFIAQQVDGGNNSPGHFNSNARIVGTSLDTCLSANSEPKWDMTIDLFSDALLVRPVQDFVYYPLPAEPQNRRKRSVVHSR